MVATGNERGGHGNERGGHAAVHVAVAGMFHNCLVRYGMSVSL